MKETNTVNFDITTFDIDGKTVFESIGGYIDPASISDRKLKSIGLTPVDNSGFSSKCGL